MRVFLTLLVLAAGSISRAGDSEARIAGLIAEAWQPHEVQVEWQFAGKTPEGIEDSKTWEIAEPRPNRLAGSLILVLRGVDGQGYESRVTVSGKAQVFGKSLTTSRTIRAGERVDSSLISETEAEWTRLRAGVIGWDAFHAPTIAARTLIPGRPLTETDLKPAPVILRNQSVQVEYEDGAVKVRLRGRALQDGAIGEKIAVAVELQKTRRLEGIVAAGGIVRLVR